jgi:hypothetical protein
MSGESSYCLGALPPELLDNVLCELESIRDLATFVATSRFVYRRFELQKRAILFSVLQNELGPVLIDARLLLLFPYSDPAGENYHDWIHTMAAVYRDMLRGGDKQGGDVPSLAELTELCRTLHDVNFLAETYMRAYMASLAAQASSHSIAPAAAPFSRAEKLRVMRAMYRRQIVSNAWAPTRRQPHWTAADRAAFNYPSERQGLRVRRLGLFGAFEPWELQQIDHVNVYIEQLCLALVHHSRKHETVPTLVIQPAQFGELVSQLDQLVRYLRSNTARADTALADLSRPIRTMYDETVYRDYNYPFRILPLASAWQMASPPTPAGVVAHPRERDTVAVEFVGDAPQLVPFAWADALGGRYINWFGPALIHSPWYPHNGRGAEKRREPYNVVWPWRRFGLALWDRRRVEALKNVEAFEGFSSGWLMWRGPEAEVVLANSWEQDL